MYFCILQEARGLLLLYVFMLISCKTISKMKNSKAQLNGAFKMKDLGGTQKILVMNIQINRKASTLFY